MTARLASSMMLLFVAACSTTTPGGGACDGSACDAGPPADARVRDSGDGGDGGCVLAIAVMNNPACTSCLRTSCCAEVNACFEVPRDAGPSDCNALNTCNTSCAMMDAGAQQACFDACNAAHPSSVASEAAWTNCASSSCPATCL